MTLDLRDTLAILRVLDDRKRQPLTLGNRTRIADLEREVARRAVLNDLVAPVVFP
jgi:hypothetical protein